MNFFTAIALGLVQGLTEFLPVSSSGHLKLAQSLFGFTDLSGLMLFDLACHGGTLMALLMVLWRDIATFNRSTVWLLGIAILPLFPCVLITHQIKAIYDIPQLLGLFFLFTALLLLASERKPLTTPKRPWLQAAGIGCFQALALFPGVSRSGATIAGGRLLGLDRVAAVRFSFLLAIPTILGSAVVEGAEVYLGRASVAPIPIACYIAGLLTAFLSGYLALRWLLQYVQRATFKPFAIYCAVIGLFSLLWFCHG